MEGLTVLTCIQEKHRAINIEFLWFLFVEVKKNMLFEGLLEVAYEYGDGHRKVESPKRLCSIGANTWSQKELQERADRLTSSFCGYFTLGLFFFVKNFFVKNCYFKGYSSGQTIAKAKEKNITGR